mgnify:CR=1 FL=1
MIILSMTKLIFKFFFKLFFTLSSISIFFATLSIELELAMLQTSEILSQ